MPKLRDERLAWLAVRDRLSRRRGLLAWLITFGSLGFRSPSTVSAGRRRRMERYSVAVDHVAGFLDEDERAALRAGGSVPRWFLPEVERVYRAVRRNRPRPGARESPARRRRRLARRALLLAALAALVVVMLPTLWVRIGAAGRITTVADAEPADVVIVFGAQIAPDRRTPMPFLRGRLDVGAQLLRDGKAKAMLISGDRTGGSGDEVGVMRAYLLGLGVDEARLVVDPYGLDTYDTCRRARDVYGVRRALLVSQALHLPRTVTLCRRLGVDARGVEARCDGCRDVTLMYNGMREVVAAPKAAWEALTHRPPAVSSPPDPTLRDAAR